VFTISLIINLTNNSVANILFISTVLGVCQAPPWSCAKSTQQSMSPIITPSGLVIIKRIWLYVWLPCVFTIHYFWILASMVFEIIGITKYWNIFFWNIFSQKISNYLFTFFQLNTLSSSSAPSRLSKSQAPL
jgi:hypothetical protein